MSLIRVGFLLPILIFLFEVLDLQQVPQMVPEDHILCDVGQASRPRSDAALFPWPCLRTAHVRDPRALRSCSGCWVSRCLVVHLRGPSAGLLQWGRLLGSRLVIAGGVLRLM